MTCLAAAALSIAAVLFAGHYTRRVKVSGHLVPSLGLASVLTLASGVVERLGADKFVSVLQPSSNKLRTCKR